MHTIPCAHELCAADHHEDTRPIRHQRVTSDEDESRYRVVASWADDDAATACVELTYQGASVAIAPREAAFWARVLTAGAAFGLSSAIAVDLGVAAELLALLDDESEPPAFGSRHLRMSIERAIARILDDEDDDEAPYVTAGTAGKEDTR